MTLLDTDVCIELLRGNQSVIAKRQSSDSSVAIAFITAGELYYGAERSTNRAKNINLVDEFLVSIDIIDTDVEILRKFGGLKAKLYKKNLLLPDADILIASTALTKCQKLVTGNIRHFNRFDGLKLENWL